MYKGMKVVVEMKGKPYDCESNHHFECPCMFGLKYARQQKQLYAEMELWQNTVAKVGRMAEFNDREVSYIIDCINICFYFYNQSSLSYRISRLSSSHSLRM